MSKITVPINIEQETLQTIEKFIKYGEIKNQYNNHELPETHEDFIKAAIYHFIKRLESIQSISMNQKTINLKHKGKIKNNLKQIMVDEELKQKDLAKLTDIDPGNISIILSNRNQPSIDYFLRIWVALKCPPIEEVFYRESE